MKLAAGCADGDRKTERGCNDNGVPGRQLKKRVGKRPPSLGDAFPHPCSISSPSFGKHYQRPQCDRGDEQNRYPETPSFGKTLGLTCGMG